jgi:hypothetical protein
MIESVTVMDKKAFKWWCQNERISYFRNYQKFHASHRTTELQNCRVFILSIEKTPQKLIEDTVE